MIKLVKKIIMKKSRIFALVFTLVCISFTFKSLNGSKFSTYIESHYPNGVNIPGYTGAPGEYTCGDCHNCDALPAGLISRFTIKDSIGNLVKAYQSNHTYTVNFADTIVGHKGFQCTVLSDSNFRAGDLVNGQNTQISTLLNKTTNKVRQYINHTSPLSTNWAFQWKAPSTNVGKVTFYFSTGNYQIIYLSNYSLLHQEDQSGSTSGVIENANAFPFKTYYSEKENKLILKCNSPVDGKSFVNIVDESGKIVYYYRLGMMDKGSNTNEMSITKQLPTGNYMVQLFVNNSFATSRVFIP